MSLRVVAVIGCIALLLLLAGAQRPIADEQEPERDVAAGKRLYEIYCQNCHGEGGRGDGITAEVMTVRPTDLTRLTRSNRGEFPYEKTRRIIDGRHRVRGHGATGMPIWGLQFQDSGSDANQEDAVNDRILDLTEYLRTLQVEPTRTGLR